MNAAILLTLLENRYGVTIAMVAASALGLVYLGRQWGESEALKPVKQNNERNPEKRKDERAQAQGSKGKTRRKATTPREPPELIELTD